MTDYSEFRLWKRTGTYADTLAAIGLSKMIWALIKGIDVQVIEATDHFRIKLSDPIDIERADLSVLQRDPLYKFIQTKPEDHPPGEIPTFNYLAEKATADAFREARKRKKAGEDLSDLQEPPSIFYVYQKINILQGINARNKLLEDLIHANSNDVVSAVKTKLTALANGQLLGDALTKFNPKVASVQVFSPSAGKGINRPKPDSAARGSLPTVFVDWFEEWLRFIGSDMALSGYTIGDDIKICVPVPTETSYSYLRDLERLKMTPAWTPRKSDLLAVFDLVHFLLEKTEVKSYNDWNYHVPKGLTPRDIFSSLQTAYFKSLGSAKPVSNISSIGLPNWFPVYDQEDVRRWKITINEHKAILHSLDEDKSEDAALLHLYRDFLSASDWLAFFRFLGSYGCLIMSRRDKKKPIRSFLKSNLEELLKMGQPRFLVTEVLSNVGFRNIGKAMKQATVSEQYLKSKGQQVFEIKYGLFQEIKRKAKFREELLAVISEFISEFNYENARREEQLKDQPGRRRKRVSVNDLVQLAELFDKYNSQKETETIAMLLIAFASAKDGESRETVEDYAEEEVEV